MNSTPLHPNNNSIHRVKIYKKKITIIYRCTVLQCSIGMVIELYLIVSNNYREN